MLDKRTFDEWIAGNMAARASAWIDLRETNFKTVYLYLKRVYRLDPDLTEQFATDSFSDTMERVEARIRTGKLKWLDEHICPEAAFNKLVRDMWKHEASTCSRNWDTRRQVIAGSSVDGEEAREFDIPGPHGDAGIVAADSRAVLECILERLNVRMAFEQATRQKVVWLTIVYVKWRIASDEDIADADIGELREIANTTASELLDGADVARVRFEGAEWRKFLVRMLFPPTDDPDEARKNRNNLDKAIGRLRPIVWSIYEGCSGCAE
jgi:hypothetical protein